MGPSPGNNIAWGHWKSNSSCADLCLTVSCLACWLIGLLAEWLAGTLVFQAFLLALPWALPWFPCPPGVLACDFGIGVTLTTASTLSVECN
jgi:hypothetical protein